MKKFIALAAALLLPFMFWGPAKIETKKMKLSDFQQKVTKVVLTGNPLHDAYLKSNVAAIWNASPFEFCTMAEYNQLKSSDSYYFLVTTKGQFKNEAEPGITFLSLVKGGQQAATGMADMLEVVSFPFASVEDASGREYVFLKAFLDVIQSYALTSMEKDINAYTGLPNYTINITKSGEMTLVFSESDLSSEITDEVKQACFDDSVLVLEEDAADEFMTPEQTNVLVSYVAVPASKQPGSFCYKMLIDPQTNTLYYFRKHKISKKFGAGFLAEDIKRITAPRKK